MVVNMWNFSVMSIPEDVSLEERLRMWILHNEASLHFRGTFRNKFKECIGFDGVI